MAMDPGCRVCELDGIAFAESVSGGKKSLFGRAPLRRWMRLRKSRQRKQEYCSYSPRE